MQLGLFEDDTFKSEHEWRMDAELLRAVNWWNANYEYHCEFVDGKVCPSSWHCQMGCVAVHTGELVHI